MHSHVPSVSVPSARRAFTLVELLTVIAIIGILAAILIPTVANMRKTVNQTRCASNLRQIHLAYTTFASENGNRILSPQRFNAYRQNPQNYEGLSKDVDLHWYQILIKYALVGRADIFTAQHSKQNADGTYPCGTASRKYFTILGCPEVSEYRASLSDAIDVPSGQILPKGDGGYMNYCANSLLANYNDAGPAMVTFDQIAEPAKAMLVGDLYKDVPPDGTIWLNANTANFPKAVHGDVSNFIFCDGHVESLNPDTDIPKNGSDVRFNTFWRGLGRN